MNWEKIRKIAEDGKLKPSNEAWDKLDTLLELEAKESKIKSLSKWVLSLSAAAVFLLGLVFVKSSEINNHSEGVYVYSKSMDAITYIDNSPLYDIQKIQRVHKAYK